MVASKRINGWPNSIMALLLLSLVKDFDGTGASNPDDSSSLARLLKKEYDICNPDTIVHNPATIYIPKPGLSTELFVKLSHEGMVAPDKCVFVVKTCSQCRVEIEVMDPEFDFTSCHQRSITYFDRCPFFTFYDGDYREQTTKTIQASYSLGKFSSETRHLFIETSRSFRGASSASNDDVTARFRVHSKLKYKVISRKQPGTSFALTSPFFPDPCIQNGETYSYQIDNLWDDYFLITFDDWLLPLDAEFRFTGSSYFDVKGSEKRRSVYSRQKRMEFTFYTGTYNRPGTYFAYPGFNATVKFSNGTMKIPVTDCDQVVKDFGGIIQIDPEKMDGSYRDCIWLVKKPMHAEGMHLTQKLMKYIDPWFNVEIREGIISKGSLMYKLDPSYDRQGLVHSLSTWKEGFYIRITGRLFHKDTLVFHYASFTSNCDAHSTTRFLCDNARCIDMIYRCDGVNHCGDNSDESKEACRTGASDRESSNHANVGIIVPLVVSLVVIIFFCLFLVGLQRCYRLSLQRLPVGHRTPSSSSSTTTTRERVDQRRRPRRNRAQSVQMSVTVTSGELPPSYNEVMTSAPLSNVNVAFTFGPGDGNQTFTSPPPSYVEAVQAVNFDLSRSNSRDDEVFPLQFPNGAVVVDGDETNDAYPSAETTFSNTVPTLPTYAAIQNSATNDTNSLSANCNPGLFGLSATNISSLVASFDPNEYVSSSSSNDCYDEDYERGNFNRGCRYPSDSSTTDDDYNADGDEIGNRLYAQAINLACASSSADNNLSNEAASSLLFSHESNSLATGPEFETNISRRGNEINKAERKNERNKRNDACYEGGNSNLDENAECNRNRMGAGHDGYQTREADIGLAENAPGNRYSYMERRGRRNQRRRQGNERRNSDEQRRSRSYRSNDLSDTLSNSSCPERSARMTDARERIQRNENIRHTNEDEVSLTASSPTHFDNDENRSRDPSDCTSPRRYSWISSSEARAQPREGERMRGVDEQDAAEHSGNSGNSESASLTVMPLTVTNYMISPERNTNSSGSNSIPIPLAQVLFKMTDEEASFV